jgi:hypothetical protein
MKEKHGLRSLNVQAKRLRRAVVQKRAQFRAGRDGTYGTSRSGDCPMEVEKKTTRTIFSISVFPPWPSRYITGRLVYGELANRSIGRWARCLSRVHDGPPVRRRAHSRTST